MKESSLCRKGRDAYARRAWQHAYQELLRADRAAPLACEDLERLAVAAYLTGRESEFLKCYERAHRAHLARGAGEHAARCAFWLGLSALLRGEPGRASGWLARGRRLVARKKCPEQGYLLLPDAERQLHAGDFQAAGETAARASAIGERFADPDLLACARHLQGRSLLHQGKIAAGVALLDEAMLAVCAGELTPVMTGLIYCSVVEACQHFYALGRAREWSSALAQWCEQQPEMVAFTATCLTHRAEILQMGGAWELAIDEARRACARFARGTDAPGAAFYQQGEVHRLRGEYDAAEAAFRKASERGFEPQPGLALLRLTQGRVGAAARAIRRVAAGRNEQLERASVLPALVEILLAAGDVSAAREASRELYAIARSFDTEVLVALADHADGAVELAEGNARAALGSLRLALQRWQQAEMPYPAAKARVLLGMACCALGDDEGAELELDAARAAFAQLGAKPDLAHLDALRSKKTRRNHRLTARELQVLRLVASGKTNKSIAVALVLSEKTVDRHLSNILTKLDVPSRAAATAYAYEHRLLGEKYPGDRPQTMGS
jgi:DNA-binding CsgD family transcriptional regulator